MRIPRYLIPALILILIVLSGWKRGYFSCSRQQESPARQYDAGPGISVASILPAIELIFSGQAE